MRLIILILTAGFLQLSASGYSQNITLSGKNLSLREVLHAVGKQSGYKIVGSKATLDAARPVTVSVKDIPLGLFLEQVFKDQPVRYEVVEKNIMLEKVKGRITLNEFNASLTKVFDKIRAQSGVDFVTSKEQLKGAKLVSIKVEGMELKEVLNKIFKDQPLNFELQEKMVVVKKKELSFFENIVARFRAVDIKGKIVDETGQPLIGATVRVINGKSMLTDSKGEFTIPDVDEHAKVEISYIGYEKLTLSASSNLSLIMLKKSESKLDEIQVIAYGTTTRRLNTGSVTKITSKEIENQPVTNVFQALEGRVPGLVISQTSGMPGASMKIQVRGQNSLNPANGYSGTNFDNPLFIIDGVPFGPQNSNVNQLASSLVLNGNASSVPGALGISALNNINPSDIESIEVLRDADATAIYGSRGANGVILITTKRGKAGPTSVSANVWTGQSQVTRSVEMMNTQEYLAMRTQALKNDGLTPSSDPSDLGYAPDLTLFDQNKYTNWQKYLLGNTAHTTDANVQISGGEANTQFLIGTGFNRESNIYPGDFADSRISFLSNIHHNSNDRKFTLDFNFNYSYDKNNMSGSEVAYQAFTLPPNYPDLKNTDGSIVWQYKGLDLGNYGLFGRNPLAYEKQPYYLRNYNLNSNLQIGYQLFTGLTLRSSFGYNKVNSNEYKAIPLSSQNPAESQVSSAKFGSNDIGSWIIEPQMEYKLDIKQTKINFLLGSTFQENLNSTSLIENSNYANDSMLESITGATRSDVSGSLSQYKYMGVFGRLNVVFKDKFILNVSGRKDGSSRFGPNKQFGNFGAIGAGWIFTEENFLKNSLPFVSFGKLRANYGTVGNDQIGNYQYLSIYKPNTNLPYQGTVSYTPQNSYNPDFSWGLTKKLEASLELGLFNNNILINATRYQSRSGNQLVQYRLPLQVGFTVVLQNAPYTVQNTGWEISVSSTNIKSKEFTWLSSFNLTIPKNELVSFPNLETSAYFGTYVEGQSVNIQQLYTSAGVDPATGLFQFRSADGTLTSSPDQSSTKDQYIFDSPDPKFYGGISNVITFKGFEFNLFVQFAKQKGFNYLHQVYNASPVGSAQNLPKFLNGSFWQSPGDNSKFAKLTSQYGDAYSTYYPFFVSDASFTDASFIRFKTTSIAYNIKQSFLEKYNIKRLKIYVNAQNLFTITNYKGDPETQNIYSVPPLRTITAGFQLSL